VGPGGRDRLLGLGFELELSVVGGDPEPNLFTAGLAADLGSLLLEVGLKAVEVGLLAPTLASIEVVI
jgi:hypothetical protein